MDSSDKAQQIGEILASCEDLDDFHEVSQQVHQMLLDFRYAFLLKKLLSYALESAFIPKKSGTALSKILDFMEIQSHSHMTDNLGAAEQVGGSCTTVSFPIAAPPQVSSRSSRGGKKAAVAKRKRPEVQQVLVLEFNAYYEYPSLVTPSSTEAGRANTKHSSFHEIMEISYYIHTIRPDEESGESSNEDGSSSEEEERTILVVGERFLDEKLNRGTKFEVFADAMEFVQKKLKCQTLTTHEFLAFLLFIFYGSSCDKCTGQPFCLVDEESADEELPLWSLLPQMVTTAVIKK